MSKLLIDKFVKRYQKSQDAFAASAKSGLMLLPLGKVDEGLYYTYFLIDPRDASIFYVGKGIRNRAKTHVVEATAGRVVNIEKHEKILEIVDQGEKIVELIATTHKQEKVAFRFEKFLIHGLKEFGLTNVAAGGGGRRRDANEIAKDHAARILDRLVPFETWIVDRASALEDGELDRWFDTMGGDPQHFHDVILYNFLQIKEFGNEAKLLQLPEPVDSEDGDERYDPIREEVRKRVSSRSERKASIHPS